jgi:hypothetical protein
MENSGTFRDLKTHTHIQTQKHNIKTEGDADTKGKVNYNFV